MADLDDILIFVKVGQVESISRAARSLGMRSGSILELYRRSGPLGHLRIERTSAGDRSHLLRSGDARRLRKPTRVGVLQPS